MSGEVVTSMAVAGKSGCPAKTKQAAKRMEILARQNRVAELRLQKYSTVQIAEKLGICERQAKYDIQRINERWQKEAVEFRANAVEEEDRLLKYIVKEAMDEWHSSGNPKEIYTTTQDADGKLQSYTIKEEPQCRDNQYLQTAIKASESRRKLLGIDKPTANEHEHVHVHAHAHQHEVKVIEDEHWYGNSAHDQSSETSEASVANAIEFGPVQGNGVREALGKNCHGASDGH